jgi:hypothetical protein
VDTVSTKPGALQLRLDDLGGYALRPWRGVASSAMASTPAARGLTTGCQKMIVTSLSADLPSGSMSSLAAAVARRRDNTSFH